MPHLRTHHRRGQFAESGDEVRPVRRARTGRQMMRHLVQYHQFSHRPAGCAALRNGDNGCAVMVFIVGGRRGTPGPDSDRGALRPVRCDGGQHQYRVNIALHRFDRSEPCFRRKCDRIAEEVNGARTVFGSAVEEGADELLGRINPRALVVPDAHRGSRVRAPGNSGLEPSRAWRPARSPARRAAEEYPAEALVARQVPRALDSLR